MDNTPRTAGPAASSTDDPRSPAPRLHSCTRASLAIFSAFRRPCRTERSAPTACFRTTAEVRTAPSSRPSGLPPSRACLCPSRAQVRPLFNRRLHMSEQPAAATPRRCSTQTRGRWQADLAMLIYTPCRLQRLSFEGLLTCHTSQCYDSSTRSTKVSELAVSERSLEGSAAFVHLAWRQSSSGTRGPGPRS